MVLMPDGPCAFVTQPALGGPLRYEGHYRDGLRDGLWSVTRAGSGGRCWEITWSMGEWHGLARAWYRNGQLEDEGEYAHGCHTGVWTYWFETGQLAAQGTYETDRKVGDWQYWDKVGRPMQWPDWQRQYGLGDYDFAYDDYTGMPRGENWPHPPRPAASDE